MEQQRDLPVAMSYENHPFLLHVSNLQNIDIINF